MKIKFALLFLIVIFCAYPCFAGTGYPDKTASIIDTTSFNDPFVLDDKGIPSLNNERKLILCISDIHLGADDSYTETKKNREPLVKFLEQVRTAPNIRELVIGGDLIDVWFVPSATEPTPEVFRMPVGWLLVPEPWIAARSISVAIMPARSRRTSISISGDACNNILRL